MGISAPCRSENINAVVQRDVVRTHLWKACDELSEAQQKLESDASCRDGSAPVRAMYNNEPQMPLRRTRTATFLCSFLLVLIALMSLFGCGGGPSTSTSASAPAPVLTRIGVSPSTASIQVGQQQSYTAVGYDQFNNVMNGIIFVWSSSGSSATVDNGLATGVSPGTVHITASASGISSASASLTVLPPPPVLTTVGVTPTASSIFVGGTQQFAAVGQDQYGNAMSGVMFTWSSSNVSVATVNVAGLTSGISVGTAQITASAQGVTSNAVLLAVAKPPSVLTSITVSPPTASVQVGNTQQFNVVGYDEYGSVMSGITLVWASSNTSVATVSSVNSGGTNAGLAMGVAAGTVRITASAQGVTSNTATLMVTAPPPPPPSPAVTTISVLPTTASINVGATQQFTAFATDQYGSIMSGLTFTWASSNPAVVTIDANGLATGVSVGTVQGSASAQGATSNLASLTVTVPPPWPSITITKLSPNMGLVGGGGLNYLTITGAGFLSGAIVNFGSDVLTPAFVNPTSIRVVVPSTDLKSAATLAVSVTNPVPNAASSNSLPFTITSSGFVSINFDDGYQSSYDNGFPILDAAGLNYTWYIITQAVGDTDYATWSEILTVYNNGHEIGNHTRTHLFLTTLTEAQMQNEIAGAQRDLQAQGITSTTFAYPSGDYNSTVESVVKGAGLRGARSSDTGYNTATTNPFVLQSQAAEPDSNTTISQITGWIDYAVANKMWLVIMFHRVDDTRTCCSSISVTHQLIQETADYLVQHQVHVVTNNEGLIIENLNAQP
jgi:peptidoglycan/xylan/chitin deacetylase (PgdA/CDA1 family)